MDKQEYYQRTESLLYKYNFISLGIENMQEELNAELINYGLGSVDPGKENFKTNSFNSTVENAVIKRNDSTKIILLRNHIKNSKNLMKKINKVLNRLDQESRQIIKLRYFEGMKWNEIEDAVKFDEKTCRNKAKKAIEKIAVGLAFAIVIEVDNEQQAV